MDREKLLRFTDEKEKAKRKAVKPDSNIGKCIVEKELSQRTEKESTMLAFHIFSTLCSQMKMRLFGSLFWLL